MTESDLTGVPPELGVLSWLDGSPHSLAGSVADVARFAARVRVEERQRIAGEVRSAAAEQAASFGPDAEPYFKGRLDGLEDAARIVAGSSAVLVATPLPVEVASLPLDELPDWTELAEAVGATLHNSEIGCSGEYETTMRWPDGRAAGNRDRLAIISADSELPSIAEQTAAYHQVEAEYAAERATRIPVATPTEPTLADMHDGYCDEPKCLGPCNCQRPARLAEQDGQR